MIRKAIIVLIFSFIGSFLFQHAPVFANGVGASYERRFEINNGVQPSSVDMQKQQVSRDLKRKYFEVVSNKRFLDSQPFCLSPVYTFLNAVKIAELYTTNAASYFSSLQLFEPSRAPPSLPSVL